MSPKSICMQCPVCKKKFSHPKIGSSVLPTFSFSTLLHSPLCNPGASLFIHPHNTHTHSYSVLLLHFFFLPWTGKVQMSQSRSLLTQRKRRGEERRWGEKRAQSRRKEKKRRGGAEGREREREKEKEKEMASLIQRFCKPTALFILPILLHLKSL